MRLRTALSVVFSVLLVLLVPPLMSTGSDEGTDQIRGLRMLVPNSPGGGYDVTARTAVKAMEDTKLNSNVEVFNLPGAGGTVGLGRVVNERGNGKLAMSMGLGVVGSVYTNHSPVSLEDTTPVAEVVTLGPRFLSLGPTSRQAHPYCLSTGFAMGSRSSW